MTDKIKIPTLEEALRMDPAERVQEIQEIRNKVIDGEDVPRELLQRALVLIDAHTEQSIKTRGTAAKTKSKTKSKTKEEREQEAQRLLDELF